MIDQENSAAENHPENHQDDAQQEQPTNGASETEALQAQLKEANNKYLYLYAEFDNYKKRVIKERSDQIKWGHEAMVRDLLQVADNLDRALEHTTNQDALVQGIRMVNQQLKDTLSRYGVQAVESLGKKFDPEQHEAVGQEKIAAGQDGHEDGSIIREHQKGYKLHGRLLRPARVVVATK